MKWIFIFLIVALLTVAFIVEDTPTDNQLANSWFGLGCNDSSFDGWIGDFDYITLSKKETNPGPCAEQGTAGKIATSFTNKPAPTGVPIALSQTVAGNGPDLEVQLWRVRRNNVVRFEINVYGSGNGVDFTGPIWTVDVKPEGIDWELSPLFGTTVNEAWAFYRVELLVELGDGGNTKFTGLYFSSAGDLTDTPTATPAPDTPTPISVTPTPTLTPTSVAPTPTCERLLGCATPPWAQ